MLLSWIREISVFARQWCQVYTNALQYSLDRNIEWSIFATPPYRADQILKIPGWEKIIQENDRKVQVADCSKTYV